MLGIPGERSKARSQRERAAISRNDLTQQVQPIATVAVRLTGGMQLTSERQEVRIITKTSRRRRTHPKALFDADASINERDAHLQSARVDLRHSESIIRDLGVPVHVLDHLRQQDVKCLSVLRIWVHEGIDDLNDFFRNDMRGKISIDSCQTHSPVHRVIGDANLPIRQGATKRDPLQVLIHFRRGINLEVSHVVVSKNPLRQHGESRRIGKAAEFDCQLTGAIRNLTETTDESRHVVDGPGRIIKRDLNLRRSECDCRRRRRTILRFAQQCAEPRLVRLRTAAGLRRRTNQPPLPAVSRRHSPGEFRNIGQLVL